MRCPSIELAVFADAPLAAGLSSRLALAEGAVSPGADGIPGSIILFVDEGRLSYLEYVYNEVIPIEWPSPDRITVFSRA